MAKRVKHPICPHCDEPVYVNQSAYKEEGAWRHRNCTMPPTRIIYARGRVPILPRSGGRG